MSIAMVSAKGELGVLEFIFEYEFVLDFDLRFEFWHKQTIHRRTLRTEKRLIDSRKLW